MGHASSGSMVSLWARLVQPDWGISRSLRIALRRGRVMARAHSVDAHGLSVTPDESMLGEFKVTPSAMCVIRFIVLRHKD